ncbi:hypothetical protein [Streptomyces fuscigenes]|uniref:hypothetical protein n=1 Tax=Streptomyces fuscigenes TaxID=1528880 RepID=UPI001F396CB6|nr:hypothetical protein [Streptomyces fuscigenes]MCF3960296.1 hypothetical protein [Streptomyces fuscigenes]
MSKITAAAARHLAVLVDAEDALTTARREEARAARTAERATLRAKDARAKVTEARKALRTAERAGKGLAVATRRLATRMERAARLEQDARTARHAARGARRDAATAARRVERIARRAALAATLSVERITTALGETSLTTPAPEDQLLDGADMPAVEDIETHAVRYAELDRQAKALSKAADAEKAWLRRLPNGQYGGVVITRTSGRSILDGAAIALDYTARGEVPPRKAARATFKSDATAALAALENADAAALILTA